MAALLTVGPMAGARAAQPSAALGSVRPPVSASRDAVGVRAAAGGGGATDSAPPAQDVLTLSPAVGPPGTVVQVTGYLRGGPTAAEAAKNPGDQFPTLCWGSCSTSLTLSVTLKWSARHVGYFTTRFTVPRVPWLTAGGAHALTAGSYAVGLQCLPSGPGCAQQPPALSAAFTMRGPGSTACQPGRRCAWLRLTPTAAAPGQTVQVTGWAPLTPVIGQPFGYGLWMTGLPPQAGDGGADLLGQVAQGPSGTLSGSFQVPPGIGGLGPQRPGVHTLALRYLFLGTVDLRSATTASARKSAVAAGTVQLAPVSFRVKAAPSWAALGRLRPLAITPNGALITQDAAHPADLAYCAPDGGIARSSDGGSTWTTIPTAGMPAALRASTYAPYLPFGPTGGSEGPPCTGVVLDPAHPGIVYATFGAASAKYGAPPTFTLGFWTGDAGRTWHLVPAPRGYVLAGFGGFQVSGHTVVALFNRQSAAVSRGRWTAERLVDAADQSWRPAALGCPAAGPCLRYGPAPNGLGPCAMNGAPQTVWASADGGRRWSEVHGVAPNACNLAQLVALGPRALALVSGSPETAYPLLLSTDGGAAWRYVALPALPGQAGNYPGPLAGLQMLPDGALAATSPNGAHLMLLPPGAGAWCVAAAPLPPGANSDAMDALAGRLWSFVTAGAYVNGRQAPARATSVPLSEVHCAGASG